jgi:hypothetical protein
LSFKLASPDPEIGWFPAPATANGANLGLAEQADEAEEWEKEEEMSNPATSELAKELERIKWYLWHGNAHKALQVLGDLEFDLEGAELEQGNQAEAYLKVFKAVREFKGYIGANQSYIVNYGDRYRNGETISSNMAETTVNQVVSKWFVKKQQQRWTKKGVHLLL